MMCVFLLLCLFIYFVQIPSLLSLLTFFKSRKEIGLEVNAEKTKYVVMYGD
jgi:hypothetical protein